MAMAGRVPEDLPKIIQSQPEATPALPLAVKHLTPDQIRRLQELTLKLEDEAGGA